MPGNWPHLRQRFAGRQAPTREKTTCLCRSLPASESCRATGLTSGNDSSAGRLLQGKKRRVFVGACLQANRAGQLALPQATIRRQAGSYKGKTTCLCGSLPASESCRATGLTSGNDSPAGRLLQGKLHLVFVGARLLVIRAAPRASPPAAGATKGSVLNADDATKLNGSGSVINALRPRACRPIVWPDKLGACRQGRNAFVRPFPQIEGPQLAASIQRPMRALWALPIEPQTKKTPGLLARGLDFM